LTLRDNIRLGADLAGQSPKRVEELGRRLGISDVLSKRPGRVSGGQRQKAAVARAVIQAPSMILADEPTAAMDPPSITTVIELLRDLARDRGSAVCVVTHDADLAYRLADRVFAFRPAPSDSGPLRSVLEEV
jgi:putative ABC transport system ATP-binding protein